MRFILPVLLIGIVLAGGSACKSRKTMESFSRGEAFSASRPDSQLTSLKQMFPRAEISQVPKGIKITFASGLLFAINSSTLSETAEQYLQQLAAWLTGPGSGNILVEGHTDITGTTDLNQLLSERRAASVKSYLVSQGIAPDRISTAGYGEARPVATNSTPEGRERNRRVTLFISP